VLLKVWFTLAYIKLYDSKILKVGNKGAGIAENVTNRSGKKSEKFDRIFNQKKPLKIATKI